MYKLHSFRLTVYDRRRLPLLNQSKKKKTHTPNLWPKTLITKNVFYRFLLKKKLTIRISWLLREYLVLAIIFFFLFAVCVLLRFYFTAKVLETFPCAVWWKGWNANNTWLVRDPVHCDWYLLWLCVKSTGKKWPEQCKVSDWPGTSFWTWKRTNPFLFVPNLTQKWDFIEISQMSK